MNPTTATTATMAAQQYARDQYAKIDQSVWKDILQMIYLYDLSSVNRVERITLNTLSKYKRKNICYNKYPLSSNYSLMKRLRVIWNRINNRIKKPVTINSDDSDDNNDNNTQNEDNYFLKDALDRISNAAVTDLSDVNNKEEQDFDDDDNDRDSYNEWDNQKWTNENILLYTMLGDECHAYTRDYLLYKHKDSIEKTHLENIRTMYSMDTLIQPPSVRGPLFIAHNIIPLNIVLAIVCNNIPRTNDSIDFQHSRYCRYFSINGQLNLQNNNSNVVTNSNALYDIENKFVKDRLDVIFNFALSSLRLPYGRHKSSRVVNIKSELCVNEDSQQSPYVNATLIGDYSIYPDGFYDMYSQKKEEKDVGAAAAGGKKKEEEEEEEEEGNGGGGDRQQKRKHDAKNETIIYYPPSKLQTVKDLTYSELAELRDKIDLFHEDNYDSHWAFKFANVLVEYEYPFIYTINGGGNMHNLYQYIKLCQEKVDKTRIDIITHARCVTSIRSEYSQIINTCMPIIGELGTNGPLCEPCTFFDVVNELGIFVYSCIVEANISLTKILLNLLLTFYQCTADCIKTAYMYYQTLTTTRSDKTTITNINGSRNNNSVPSNNKKINVYNEMLQVCLAHWYTSYARLIDRVMTLTSGYKKNLVPYFLLTKNIDLINTSTNTRDEVIHRLQEMTPETMYK